MGVYVCIACVCAVVGILCRQQHEDTRREKERDRETERPRERDRQADRQTKTDRQTDGQKGNGDRMMKNLCEDSVTCNENAKQPDSRWPRYQHEKSENDLTMVSEVGGAV